jgi:hypothetical protein
MGDNGGERGKSEAKNGVTGSSVSEVVSAAQSAITRLQ